MTVQAVLCPLSVQTLFDQNACPVRGGYIFVYAAETTNLIQIFADEGMATPLPNPVRTSGFGRIPKIWVGEGAYKVVLQDQFGGLIETIDDLPGGVDVEPPTVVSSWWNTADVKAAHTDDTQDGWLFLNGQTIGSSASAATSRANDDCQLLYTKLWNKDASLVVTPNRGLSAALDWAAAKPLALPDYRGRAFVGVDQMGAPITAGALTAATTGTPNVIGTHCGSETNSLTTNELPAFTPIVTVNPGGGFTPAGTIGNGGGNTPTGNTSTDGDHTHENNVNFITAASGSLGALGGGQGQFGTLSAGAHNHTLNINPIPDHTHPFTGTAQPDHTHTATAAPIGGGAPHGNVQPSILGYWLIKL